MKNISLHDSLMAIQLGQPGSLMSTPGVREAKQTV